MPFYSNADIIILVFKYRIDKWSVLIMKNIGRIFLVIGVIMFIVAVIFLGYVLNHPESTSPFSNTMLFFKAYIAIMIVAFIVSAILLTISKKNA